MASQPDIIDLIDDALSCAHCVGPLGDSPSPHWCSEACQGMWQAGHGEPLPASQAWDEADLTVATAAARLRPRLAEALYIEVDTAELERRLAEFRAAGLTIEVERAEHGEIIVTARPPERRRGDPMRGWLARVVERIRGGGR